MAVTCGPFLPSFRVGKEAGILRDLRSCVLSRLLPARLPPSLYAHGFTYVFLPFPLPAVCPCPGRGIQRSAPVSDEVDGHLSLDVLSRSTWLVWSDFPLMTSLTDAISHSVNSRKHGADGAYIYTLPSSGSWLVRDKFVNKASTRTLYQHVSLARYLLRASAKPNVRTPLNVSFRTRLILPSTS